MKNKLLILTAILVFGFCLSACTTSTDNLSRKDRRELQRLIDSL
jgi:starvation-inducible outer membrane lipoprotein